MTVDELNKQLQDPSTRRRIEQMLELHEVCRELALAGIRMQHPQASRAEQLLLLRKRLEGSRQAKWRRS